jgi:pyruvate dehydrogenase E1 component alpha subunit/2-oxoisovalerate dehydrogenase E1 component alpha subunit
VQSDGRTRRAAPLALPAEELQSLLEAMIRVRVVDARMLALQRQGRIGFYGPITGQEAATVGSGHALRPEDWVVPALREGALAVMRGMPLRDLVAQCMGSSLDRAHGRQMPCHYSWPRGRYVAMSSCVGNQLPAAVGIAWGVKHRGERAVVAAYLGDGATSTPDFSAAANFAGVWRVPVVFFCQNNQWSISVPARGQTSSETIAAKARAFGFEGERVDGNDVFAVVEASRRAVERAREGGGPTLLELVTYRILGHTSSDDPSRYRDEEEVASWKARDPIDRARRLLEERGLWSAEREEALRASVEEELAAAIREVESSPPPDLDTLFTDVFAEPSSALHEQREDMCVNRRQRP